VAARRKVTHVAPLAGGGSDAGVVQIPLRLAGTALVAAGLLVMLATPHPSIIGDRSVAEVVLATGTWRLMHYAVAVAAIGAAIGVIGLVGSYNGRLGPLAYPALIATTVGSIVTAAIMVMEAVMFPLVASRAPDLIAFDGPVIGSWWLRAGGSLAGGLEFGLMALGLMAYREGTHRGAGAALVVGPLSYVALGVWFVPYLGPLSTVMFGAVVVWWGVIVWRAHA
jgi:hypothetical protein